MAYRIEWEAEGAIVRLGGTVVVADYLDLVEEYRAHPCDHPSYHLYDYSASRGFQIDANELVRLRQTVRSVRRSAAPMFVATVDTSKIARRFVGRLLTHRVSPFPMESFLSEEAARRWVERRLAAVHANLGCSRPIQPGGGSLVL